jgi:formyltetrahydrofolate deformylase
VCFFFSNLNSCFSSSLLPVPPCHVTFFFFVKRNQQAFSLLLYGHGANIIDAEQHTDVQANRFFQRIVFDYGVIHTDRISIENGIQEVSTRFQMNYQIDWGGTKHKKICIFVSKYDHVIWELLLRHKAGELPHCEIALIISNHEDLRPIADHFGIRYEVFKVTKSTKREQEDKEIELMKSLDIDLVVLARYMQIITDEFCATYKHSVINIHHSFLPAFIGAKPYHRAHARGVKLVGATAHYATENLDEGPIIEQDVARITHRNTVDDLVAKGRVLEREVLFRAVKAHIENRIVVYENKCVVFGN